MMAALLHLAPTLSRASAAFKGSPMMALKGVSSQ